MKRYQVITELENGERFAVYADGKGLPVVVEALASHIADRMGAYVLSRWPFTETKGCPKWYRVTRQKWQSSAHWEPINANLEATGPVMAVSL